MTNTEEPTYPRSYTKQQIKELSIDHYDLFVSECEDTNMLRMISSIKQHQGFMTDNQRQLVEEAINRVFMAWYEEKRQNIGMRVASFIHEVEAFTHYHTIKAA